MSGERKGDLNGFLNSNSIVSSDVVLNEPVIEEILNSG
jgi:hypothetical protein